MKPSVLILRTAGTNCDAEAAHAFELAGANVASLHLNRLLENAALLHQHQMICLPGGFSYGDDISAGRIFANQIVHRLADAMRKFVDDGKPILGVCNGFQVLVKTHLLPGPIAGRTGQTCTLTNNDSGRFIDRWIRVRSRSSKCIWTKGLPEMDLPIAHGEGKFVPADDIVRQALWDADRVALTYTSAEKEPHDSGNPNGSVDDIAGICDETGLVFGLMPHPERHFARHQQPDWAARHENAKADSEAGYGLQLFCRAVDYCT